MKWTERRESSKVDNRTAVSIVDVSKVFIYLLYTLLRGGNIDLAQIQRQLSTEVLKQDINQGDTFNTAGL
mgnify:FL=1